MLLDELRGELDRIDGELLDVLSRRAAVVRRVVEEAGLARSRGAEGKHEFVVVQRFEVSALADGSRTRPVGPSTAPDEISALIRSRDSAGTAAASARSSRQPAAPSPIVA